jgi:peptide/nickel transport system substrate-binding protein/oligopeptide transport system substrate-binding protein
VQLDDHLGVELWAATHIAVSPDGTTYTFTLRPNMAWSDGTPITAGDFAFAINRALSPCTQSGAAYILFPIAGAAGFNNEPCVSGHPSGPVATLIGQSLQVIDDRTLVIHLQAAAAYFLEALTYPTSWAVPQTLISTYGARWTDHLANVGGLGGDLFKVAVWQPGRALVLQRNPRSWGAPPKLREVDFSVYATNDAMYAAYLAGTGDISYVAFDQYTSASVRPDFHQTGTLAIVSFALNWAEPPFDDESMRQAFALALDKTRLVRDVFGDTFFPTNHIVPEGMPGYNRALTGPDNTQSLTGNVTSASALAQAYASDRCGGQLSRCPPVVLAVPNHFAGTTNQFASLASEARVMWLQAMPGYPITIRSLSFSDQLAAINDGKAQIWTFAWSADYPDPHDWLSNLFLPNSPFNLGHVNLPEANTLMLQADAEQDLAQRMSEYHQAEQLLVIEVAWIPLQQLRGFYVARSAVTNFQVTGLGQPSSDTWQRIYIARH